MNRILLLTLFLLLGFVLSPRDVMAQKESKPVKINTETLNIVIPLSDKVTVRQLEQIAKDIRRVEESPMAEDYDEAFAALLEWIVNSPDITVPVCTNMFHTDDKNDKIGARLVGIYILSSAAWMIENPDDADDKMKVTIGGIRGMLHAYDIAREALDEEVLDDSVEDLRGLDANGKLEEHVAEALEACEK